VSVNEQNQENKDLRKIDVSKMSEKFRAYFEAREALIEKYAKPKLESAA
jgi:hypothetical protein